MRIIDFGGTITVDGESMENLEIVGRLNAVPEFSREFNITYFTVSSHVFLMILSALVTLFQTNVVA